MIEKQDPLSGGHFVPISVVAPADDHIAISYIQVHEAFVGIDRNAVDRVFLANIPRKKLGGFGYKAEIVRKYHNISCDTSAVFAAGAFELVGMLRAAVSTRDLNGRPQVIPEDLKGFDQFGLDTLYPAVAACELPPAEVLRQVTH